MEEKLYALCDKTNTKRTAIDHLLEYYQKSLGWTKEEAISYAIKLFEDGVIDEIKMFGLNGNELTQEAQDGRK